jgi:hypothetical protein
MSEKCKFRALLVAMCLLLPVAYLCGKREAGGSQNPIAVELTNLTPADGKLKTVTLEPLFVVDAKGNKTTLARPEPNASTWKVAIVYAGVIVTWIGTEYAPVQHWRKSISTSKENGLQLLTKSENAPIHSNPMPAQSLSLTERPKPTSVQFNATQQLFHVPSHS